MASKALGVKEESMVALAPFEVSEAQRGLKRSCSRALVAFGVSVGTRVGMFCAGKSRVRFSLDPFCDLRAVNLY